MKKYFVSLSLVAVFFSSVLAHGSPHAALKERQLNSTQACFAATNALPPECVQYLNADIYNSTACSTACGGPLYIAYQVCHNARRVVLFDL